MSPPDPSRKHVTLRDIAAELGVSHSTVSLALRDHPRISEPMREKVKRKAEQMGYKPDPMLGALAKYRRGRLDKPINASLAWINAWPSRKELRAHKEFDHYWEGARSTAERFGFRLEEFRLGGKFTPERLHQIFTARAIRGLLLPPHREQPDWGDFPWEHYSVVRFGRSLRAPGCHLVTADQLANTILAYREMHRRGYQRIGFVAQALELKHTGLQFELGYLGGQRMVDGAANLPTLLLDQSDPRMAARRFKKWLKDHRPDAIFTTLPEMPEMLEEAGLKVPDDIGLAASTILDTDIDAGVDQHPGEIGRVGFLMLNSLISDGSKGIPKIFRQILVEGSWIDGSSLPDRR